ncbi:hypothetical protein BDP55DRAFT_628138 [Colletotrichum godetiae]|uniref:Uncharacterized protein n=1 Tax=Colletotrichum godetiae TaxID=1209918 RepID=A0AAJ0AUA0_9PEZI|nr:uncharacterized protein BDP55DRAFT_628138 [Colletotrichum godetiae]KAK1690479.1 hypothetical protein BDP55DRAFT_628138 [Colletotrichum godetiae]
MTPGAPPRSAEIRMQEAWMPSTSQAAAYSISPTVGHCCNFQILPRLASPRPPVPYAMEPAAACAVRQQGPRNELPPEPPIFLASGEPGRGRMPVSQCPLLADPLSVYEYYLLRRTTILLRSLTIVQQATDTIKSIHILSAYDLIMSSSPGPTAAAAAAFVQAAASVRKNTLLFPMLDNLQSIPFLPRRNGAVERQLENSTGVCQQSTLLCLLGATVPTLDDYALRRSPSTSIE